MIIDSHAHYDDEKFDSDRAEVLEKIKQKGIAGVVNPASNLASAYKCKELAGKYEFLYTAVGVHPHDAKDFSEDTLDTFRKFTSNKKVVAVGEVGLDYYYDFSPREIQKNCFAEHIRLALELKLPLIIHDREAHKDIIDIMKAENAYLAGGVFHCFTGSVEMAREVLSLGFHIGLGGAVTFKNAVKPVEVAKFVPLDRLLVETDCPYMAPVPYRGMRNDSGYLPEIIERIAEIRGIQPERIAAATAENAIRLFGLGLDIR